MDCLYAKCTPVITDCVMAELEKLGPKYRIAMRIARDERWERIKCDHKGTYADVWRPVREERKGLLTGLCRIVSWIGCRSIGSTWLAQTIAS